MRLPSSSSLGIPPQGGSGSTSESRPGAAADDYGGLHYSFGPVCRQLFSDLVRLFTCGGGDMDSASGGVVA